MAIIDYGSLTYKRNKSQFKNISKVTLSFSCNIFLQQMPILVRIKSTFLLVPPILVSPTQRRLVKQCTALSLTLQHHTPLLVAYFQLIQPRKSHHNPTLMFGHRLEGGLETNELQQHSLIEHFRVDTQSGQKTNHIYFSWGLEKVRSRLVFWRMEALKILVNLIILG